MKDFNTMVCNSAEDVKKFAKCIIAYANCIQKLNGLEASGLAHDLFDVDGPLFEDDDGTINGRRRFYHSLIEDYAKAIKDYAEENR